MAKSEEQRNQVLDMMLGNVTPTVPGPTVWVALYIVAPTSLGGGIEVATGDYVRVALPNDLTTWPDSILGHKSNGITIRFPTPSASWGTVVAWGIHKHVSDDDLVVWGPLVSGLLIGAAADVEFAPGDFGIDEG